MKYKIGQESNNTLNYGYILLKYRWLIRKWGKYTTLILYAQDFGDVGMLRMILMIKTNLYLLCDVLYFFIFVTIV